MPFEKLFPNLEINNHSKKNELDYATDLAPTLFQYSFSVVWTRSTDGLSCSLNYLGGNIPPSNKWHDIITRPNTDEDGEISISIGRFPVGSAINLSYGIFAIDPIPEIAVLITNIDTRSVVKIPTGSEFKKLARGESWTDVTKLILH